MASLELNCKETESRMPLSGDKTNILLPKHFAGQSYELVFVFVSRLEDALIVIAEATPCRQDLRLRELPLSSCSKNRDCKVSLFLVLFVSLCVSLFIASPNSLLAYQGSWRQASHSICRPDSHRSSALPRNNQSEPQDNHSCGSSCNLVSLGSHRLLASAAGGER
jgi:hypothetical protein